MRDLRPPERAALDAVARRLSATWEEGGDSADAHLTVAGRRIAVDVATLERRDTDRDDPAKVRLRFDKVVIRLMERLQAALGETVPEGTTVLATVTAPIRLAAKTAAELEAKIWALLGRSSPGRDEEETIHGNRVRIRLLRGAFARAARSPKLIGFVHNPDVDSRRLLNRAGEWLGLIGAAAGRRAARPAGDRWLVVTSAGGASYLEVYRHVSSQVSPATGFAKILLVLGDGRVEELGE